MKKNKFILFMLLTSMLPAFMLPGFAQQIITKDTVWVRYMADGAEWVKISKTNKYIATLGITHTFFYDFQTGNEIDRIEGYGQGYFINNDNQFIRINKDFTGIEIIDLKTLQSIDTLETDGKLLGQFTAISKDEKYFVSKILGGIRIWDIPSRKIIKTLEMKIDEPDLKSISIGLLNIDCNNLTIFAGIGKHYKDPNNQNKEIVKSYITRYNLLTLDSISTYEIGYNYVISNNCNYYANNFFSSDSGVNIYDLNTKELLWTFPINGASITGMEFSPDDKYFVTSNQSGASIINIWEMNTGKSIHNYTISQNEMYYGFNCVDLSDDGKFIATSSGNYLFLYNAIYDTSVFKEDNNIIIIYPNPTTGIATLKFNQEFPEITNIFLSDINGKKLKTIFNKFLNQGQQNIELNVSDLAAGIYFIVIENKHQSVTFKLIINR